MKGILSAYLNLLKTSIGSGVLSFPFLFMTYGIVPAVLFTLFIGLAATTGLILLTRSSQTLGRSADLSKLADRCFPYARIFVDFAVFVKCFGVSLSYIIITKQLLSQVIPVLIAGDSFIKTPSISLLIFVLFISPFAYFSRLDRLKYSSFIGIFSIVLVIIAAVVQCIRSETKMQDIVLIAPITAGWITGLGKFVFSFTCHQNIFAVNAELENNSPEILEKLICTVSLSSFTLYISFGLANYLLYGKSVAVNALESYSLDPVGIFVRCMYIIVMGVSYPLQLSPARTYILCVFRIPERVKKHKTTNFLATTVLILATYVIAVLKGDLGVVYSIVGATASCFMCLILPALFYFYMDCKRTYFLVITAYISFLLGVFIFVTTIFAMISKAI